jgi:hypothetical protein
VIQPYTRLEAGWYGNRKYLALSDRALRLWMLSLNWSVSTGSDGVIPAEVKRRRTPDRSLFAAFMGGSEHALDRAIAELADAGRWEAREDGGWDIHDFHKSQLSKEEVEQMREDNDRERAAARERMRRRRSASSGSDSSVENDPSEGDATEDSEGETAPGAARDGPMFARTVRPNSSPDRSEGLIGQGGEVQDPDPGSGLTAALSHSRLRRPRAASEEPIQDQDFELPPELAGALTDDQTYLLTKVGRSTPAFGSLSAGQIERHRHERGDGFVSEVLRVLVASIPGEVASPAGYFDSIAERIGPDWDAFEARKAAKTAAIGAENGAERRGESFPESAVETVAVAAAGSEG